MRARGAAFDTLTSRVRAALEAACGAPDDLFGSHIRTALEQAAPLVDLLSSEILRGSAERYTRHLLASDAAGRFAAAALIWRPGQMTPVHGHHTWCGYRVVRGVLTEEVFEWDETETRAISRGSRERAAGAASFVGAGVRGIHRLANLSDEIAVSLHVYGVHADAIATRVNHCVETAEPRKAA
ncbi:MAG TPA: cysteine dioxygenase family protein [Pararobbsia sp.]|nr:cysteine dioxygenase family protein [Pararobbsia sp.]